MENGKPLPHLELSSKVIIHYCLIHTAGSPFPHPLCIIDYPCVLCAKSLQSWPTLCDPMGCSPLVSSVHGILQARILEWAAISFSKGSSRPRDWTRISYITCIGRQVLYHYCHLLTYSYRAYVLFIFVLHSLASRRFFLKAWWGGSRELNSFTSKIAVPDDNLDQERLKVFEKLSHGT